MIEYSASERASRPDELSTVTAAVVQYIGCCCIPFFATSAHRTLPGPGVYRFEFSRKAVALTRKRKATQRAAFLPNLAPALMSLSSVALSSDASKSTFMVRLFSPHVNIQRRGDTVQSRRRHCSISAESPHNSVSFDALARRYTQVMSPTLNKII